MTKRSFILGMVLLLVVFGAPSLGSGERQDNGDGGEAFIVGFHELPHDRARYQGQPVTFADDDLRYFVVEAEHARGFQNQAKNDDRVRYVQENHDDFELHYEPNDARYPDQYGPQATDTHWAWSTTLGSTAVTIGFLDTGITVEHEDIDEARVTGYNYVDDNGDISDYEGCDYHGSHVAGIAAALTGNEAGIAGMSQSSIIMQKMWGEGLLECSNADVSDFAQALKDLADQGAHISSNSWGGNDDQAIHDAIAYANDRGVIHVAAAGNHGPCSDCVDYPWRNVEDNVVIVSASEAGDTFADFSSQGPEVSVIAPGDDVLSIDGGTSTGYQTMRGTSMAAPHVSGAIALYIDAHGHPGDHSTMEQLVRDAADDIWLPEEQQGDGRLNTAILVRGESVGPTAAFTSQCEELTCAFNASDSFDNQDEIVEHIWQFTESQNASGETVENTYDEGNSYRVELTVFNGTGATDTTDGYVTVNTVDSDHGTQLFADGFEDGDLWSWTEEGDNSLWRIADDCTEPWAGNHMLAFSLEGQCDYDEGERVRGSISTPRIDATGMEDVRLSFAHIFEVEDSGSEWDVLRVKASGDGGRNYDTLAQWDGRNHTNGAWEELAFNLSAYATDQLTLQFSFDSYDYVMNDLLGWYIDDIEVTAFDPTGSMHVHAIDMASQGRHASFDVSIYDHGEAPVEGASVTIELCPEGDACRTLDATTDQDGIAHHRVKHLAGETVTLCVVELVHDERWWYPTMDHAADGNCETGIA